MTSNPGVVGQPAGPLEASPIVAYRWFQVRSDGLLSGAQNMPWPVDDAMRADHVATPIGLRVAAGITVVVGTLSGLAIAGLVSAGLLMSPPITTRIAVSAGAYGIGALTVALGLAVTIRPFPRSRHICPEKPRRLPAGMVKECGIYGFREPAQAANDAATHWHRSRTIVLARVAFWGRVWPYSGGYRAEWARIEAIFDDGSGRVELPAAAYRVPLDPFPAGLPLPGCSAGGRTRRAQLGRLSRRVAIRRDQWR